MSLNAFAPVQLQQLPEVLAKLISSSEMVSKRPVRVYMEEENDLGEPTYSSKRTSIAEEAESVEMERNSSSSSSSSSGRSSLEIVLPPEPLEPEIVDLGKDLPGVFGRQANLGKSSGNSGNIAIPMGPRPLNFGVVVPGVFRCSYPKTEDHRFIQGLNLKTVVTLVDKDLPQGYESFLLDNDITHHIVSMKGTKKEEIPIRVMKSILRLVLDQHNHPLLIHCNHGKHRTGCVVGIVRKISGWRLAEIIDEYRFFAEPKVRECDINYIARFQLRSLANLFTDATAVGLRVPTFFRTTFFTFFVLAIWMISGSQMTIASSRPHW